jgi:hypothetical protein
MARPPAYKLADGSRVPGVTTIINRFKDSGGLIHWAWEQGRDGKDFRETRDDAAEAGTLAHHMVEEWINKREVPVIGNTEVDVRAGQAFRAFLEWADQTQLQVTDTEVSLISENHRFGGTLDAMLVKGKRALGDWKSSNGIYPDYLVQIAAYGILWEEHFPNKPIEGGFHLIRFDKTYGDFHAHWWAELETAKRAFLLMRELYDCDKELKARAK